MSSTTFDLQCLLDEATRKAGQDDFGKDDFLPGLTALLQAYENGGFTEKAARATRARVLNLLVARLKIEAGWKKHPEIFDIEIKSPLFLTGLPRTGTSALLNILSRDAGTRTLKLWEAMHPYPMDRALQEGEQDPRYVSVKEHFEMLNAKSDFKKLHFTTADTPEECIHLTNHTFCDPQYGAELFIEPYASFYKQVDRVPQYQYHLDILRMIQWQRPGERWLLKAPSHIGALDLLQQFYPGCDIIITHRNPVYVIASYCSLMLWNVPGRENVDKLALGRQVLDHWATEIDKSMVARQAIPADNILDIHYEDFIDSNSAVVKQIIDYFKLPVSPSSKEAIQTYIDQHPANKHGSHDYKLEEFGLTEQKILDRFGTYIDTYNVNV